MKNAAIHRHKMGNDLVTELLPTLAFFMRFYLPQRKQNKALCESETACYSHFPFFDKWAFFLPILHPYGTSRCVVEIRPFLPTFDFVEGFAVLPYGKARCWLIFFRMTFNQRRIAANNEYRVSDGARPVSTNIFVNIKFTNFFSFFF